jgi:hypothetical protein
MAAFQTKSTDSVSVVTGTAAAASLDADADTVAAAATAGEKAHSSSRKRPYSWVKKNDVAKKSLKGLNRARVETTATNVHHPPVSRFPASNRGPSSTDQLRPVLASRKGLSKWQIDKLMDWMKENDYNSSPDLAAIDDLVESTGMKPSQIVAWTAELGASIVKFRNGGPVADSAGLGVKTAADKPEIITIDDDDDDEDVSVPELAEENDKDDDITGLNGLTADKMIETPYAKPEGISPLEATDDVNDGYDEDEATWDRFIAEFFGVMDTDELDSVDDEVSISSIAEPCSAPRDAFEVHNETRNECESEGEAALESSYFESFESWELLVLEMGFNFDDECECGASISSECLQEGTSVPCMDGKSSDLLLGSLTTDEDALIKELALSLSDEDDDPHSSSTRIRSDSMDCMFGCLLP